MRTAPLVFAVMMAFLAVSACGRAGGAMTDIAGGMPKLQFHLTRAGLPVSADEYRGKIVLLYFGYTNCPDVCPTTLANLTEILGRIKDPNLRILFVTVDPSRDSDAVLQRYAAAFSPQVEGLRGNSNQLAELARRYRVAYTVDKGPPYSVMHSNAVFVFDRDGRARFVTTDTGDSAGITSDLRRLLD